MTDTSFCENCGAALTVGAKFCEECGEEVKGEAEFEAIPAVPSVPNPAPPAVVRPVPVQAASHAQSQVSRKKDWGAPSHTGVPKKKASPWLWVGLGAGLVALVICFGGPGGACPPKQNGRKRRVDRTGVLTRGEKAIILTVPGPTIEAARGIPKQWTITPPGPVRMAPWIWKVTSRNGWRTGLIPIIGRSLRPAIHKDRRAARAVLCAGRVGTPSSICWWSPFPITINQMKQAVCSVSAVR